MTLSALYERIALRRVHDGHVVYQGWRYLDGGEPVATNLATTLDALFDQGLTRLSDPVPQLGNALRLSLTPEGVQRFHVTCGPHASPSHTPEGNADPAGTVDTQPGSEPLMQFPQGF